MDRVYDFLKFNGTVTGGEYESDEVSTVPYGRNCQIKEKRNSRAQIFFYKDERYK